MASRPNNFEGGPGLCSDTATLKKKIIIIIILGNIFSPSFYARECGYIRIRFSR